MQYPLPPMFGRMPYPKSANSAPVATKEALRDLKARRRDIEEAIGKLERLAILRCELPNHWKRPTQ
jgi:hypothetical protein